MKVLMINSVCGIKSTGRIATDLADMLTEQGHTVKIAYGRESVPKKYRKYAIRIGTDWDVRLHGGVARILDNAGFGSRKATLKFIDFIKEFAPDIIHLHNLHGYYINVEILFEFLKEYNKPVVWTLHDCWAFTGHCSYFDLHKCYKWQTGCCECPQKKEYPASLLFDNSRKNYIHKKKDFQGVNKLIVVTPSQWLANLVKESFLQKYETRVINNGIDLTLFKPTDGDFRERYNLEDKIIVLGVASAWGVRKGLADFIELRKLLDSRYEIVLVGVSEEDKDILPEGILGITRTDSVKELAEIYTTADIFVNLTYEDNYPTVNLEAQACGTPVLTYRTGGSVESVPDEQVAEQGNLQNIVELIEKYEGKGASIQSFYDKNIAFEKYIELYEEIW
ncbi:MAG: glycosyltransferase [Catonella sp.]|uniref:glycosyltransferase n=1 Tax=Catonella sp. TaxID=2382125 RepID=UPI003FA0B21A